VLSCSRPGRAHGRAERSGIEPGPAGRLTDLGL